MSEFHDPELRQELGRLSGPYPDDNAAFAAWQKRVGQVRRRRAMAWTTGAAMSLIVAVVGVAALQAPSRQTIVPQKASETTDTVTASVATTVEELIITESTAASTTAATTTLAADTTPASEVGADTSMPETAANTDATSGATTPKGQSGSTGTSGTSGTSTTATMPTTDETDSHNATKTVQSIGGSITVRNDTGRLIIIDITPVDGFEAQQTDHFDRQVGVTFTSATHKSEITVKLDHGKMTDHVNETNQTHEESGPGSSYGGDYGGG